MIENLTLWNLAIVSAGETIERRAAYEQMPMIIKSQAELFLFLHYRESHAGWSRGLRTAVNRWLMFAIESGIPLTVGEWLYGWNLVKLIQKSHPQGRLKEALRDLISQH